MFGCYIGMYVYVCVCVFREGLFIRLKGGNGFPKICDIFGLRRGRVGIRSGYSFRVGGLWFAAVTGDDYYYPCPSSSSDNIQNTQLFYTSLLSSLFRS